ncbi:hypothetical protein H2248_012254 [Termitomyces sp. 'cryptogamus']|nr:hypothetical protein H2248_012254 [Termitomyces sp. 'cryptogamus']
MIRLIEDVRVYGSISTSLFLSHFTSSPPPLFSALVLALRTSNATPPACRHSLPSPHVQNVRISNTSYSGYGLTMRGGRFLLLLLPLPPQDLRNYQLQGVWPADLQTSIRK